MESLQLLETCRVCFSTKKSLIPIFDEKGITLKIASVLSKHFWFQVRDNDEFSKSICSECWISIETFHLFYEKITIIHNKMQSTIDCLVNIKTDVSTTIKKEDVNDADSINDTNAISNQCFVEESCNNDSSLKQCRFDKESSDELDEEDSQSSSDSSDFIPSTAKRRKKHVVKKSAKRSNFLNLDEKTQLKLDRKDKMAKEDAQIRQHFLMQCSICKSQFETFLQAQSHYFTEHKTKGYLKCCDRKFFRRGTILEHIQYHVNPETFKCNICNKIYADKCSLNSHLEHHLPADDRKYKCSFCQRAFTKQFRLNVHIRMSHCTEDNKKFACNVCEKRFAANSLLQSHIRGVHEFANVQVCEICAKVFKSKQVLDQHRETHLNNMPKPKFQCTLCGSWLSSERGLHYHMLKHEEPEQRCTICNKTSPNRHALQKHIKTVHVDRTHQCKICEKSFKNRIGLKEHMAIHTGEVLYTCPYCSQSFKSGSNMHSHRKKSHFEEWERDRKKRAEPRHI